MKPDAFKPFCRSAGIRSRFPSCHNLCPLATRDTHPSSTRGRFTQSPDPTHLPGTPSLALQSRPSGRAECHLEPLLAQVDVPLPRAAKSQPNQIAVAGRLVPLESMIGCDRGRAAGAPLLRARIGQSCRQSAGTDSAPLSIWLTAGEKLGRFSSGEPVAVLAACSRNRKHRGKQSYLLSGEVPYPPSVNYRKFPGTCPSRGKSLERALHLLLTVYDIIYRWGRIPALGVCGVEGKRRVRQGGEGKCKSESLAPQSASGFSVRRFLLFGGPE